MITITGDTAAEVYEEGLNKLRICGVRENTRNGDVISLTEPCIMTLRFPQFRVLDDPTRNANPFFHMMEFVWMMAGRDDAEWLQKFNKRMGEYADDGKLNAAYGHRWRVNFAGLDQISWAIEALTTDRTSRQVVLTMWDPNKDTAKQSKDRACNTHIYFRVIKNRLNMLVCNRSNDFVWGACGANIVHMTMLHELIAHFVGITLGDYQVMSNNMHIYTKVGSLIMNQQVVNEIYRDTVPSSMEFGPSYNAFIRDCRRFCQGELIGFTTGFIESVIVPAYMAWHVRKTNLPKAYEWIQAIQAPDWKLACEHWLQRRYPTEIQSFATSMVL